MANLRNITELPLAESAEGLNLIVNDGGSAKQIAASAVGAQADWAETDETNPAFIKNKPHRELKYEWNFEADSNPDNCVWVLMENVDEDDISWLTTLSEDCGWEIEVSQYGLESYWDSDNNISIDTIYPEIYTTVIMNEKKHNVGFQNNNYMNAYICTNVPMDYLNGGEINYYSNCCYVDIYNKVHFDNNCMATEVNNGGCIWIYVGDGGPLKSIKIYKAYR